MTPEQARDILTALADGCDPTTGETLPVGHILLEEDVIEALLIAIDGLRGSGPTTSVALPEQDIQAAMGILQDAGRRPTANSIAGFLLGDRAFKFPELLGHPFHGKLAGRFTKGAFRDQIEAWLAEHHPKQPRPAAEAHPYFEEPPVNRLTERAIQQLREKVAALPMQKTEGLSEALIERRKIHPRSHEPWPEEELRLLTIALQYTNDTEFLADCFGRSVASIVAQGTVLLTQGHGGGE
ncbi:MAG: hypothetical protein U0176_04395 [Bacteroidia bacterium]